MPAASASDSRVAFTNININNVFNYINSTSRKHQYDLYFGQTYQHSYTSNNGVTSEGFGNDYTRQVSAGQIQINRSGNETEFKFNSVFFNGNYKYDNRFVFNGTIRTDGSSRFGSENRYGVFPALGTAWIISNDSIFLRYKERHIGSPLELARFNVSYGRSGNAEVNNFQSYNLWASNAVYNNQPGVLPKQLGNNGVTWEVADQIDVSLLLGFWKDESAPGSNRVETKIAYYNRRSNDLLLALPLPLSTGIELDRYVVNQGVLSNSGVEFDITTQNFIPLPEKGRFMRNFRWTTNFNISFNRNIVQDIGGLKPEEVSGSVDVRVYEGEQVSTFYLPEWAGVDPATGKEQIYRVLHNDDGSTTLTDEKFTPTRLSELDSNRIAQFDKPAQPLFFGGLNNTFTFGDVNNNNGYGSVSLSVLFTFTYGNWVLDVGERRQSYFTGATNLRRDVLNAWTEENRDTDVPIMYYSGINVKPPSDQSDTENIDDPFRFRNTTRFLHDASYIRLKTVSIGWNLPTRWAKTMKLNNVRIFANAQNLLVFSKFPGWDPEVQRNLQNSQEQNLLQGVTELDFPQVRIITGGISVGF